MVVAMEDYIPLGIEIVGGLFRIDKNNNNNNIFGTKKQIIHWLILDNLDDIGDGGSGDGDGGKDDGNCGGGDGDSRDARGLNMVVVVVVIALLVMFGAQMGKANC